MALLDDIPDSELALVLRKCEAMLDSGSTVASRPFHSKQLGLLSPEEPETSSIIAPSAKISAVLMMHLLVAFDTLFGLVFTLAFKDKFPRCNAAVHEIHNRLAPHN
jgi:hypothetical protein